VITVSSGIVSLVLRILAFLLASIMHFEHNSTPNKNNNDFEETDELLTKE
jgi:hypothetical protein